MDENKLTPFDAAINFLSIFFIIIGLVITLPSLTTVYYVQMGRHWPQTDGKIISSEVQKRWSLKEDGAGQEYVPRIWFSYRVNGQEYISKTFQFIDVYTKDRELVEEIVKTYSPGNVIRVSYYPRDPGIAAVNFSNLPFLESVKLGLGILLIVSGIVSFFGIFGREMDES